MLYVILPNFRRWLVDSGKRYSFALLPNIETNYLVIATATRYMA